jgi:hypothetical protein
LDQVWKGEEAVTDFSESAHPRVPAGSSKGGEFTRKLSADQIRELNHWYKPGSKEWDEGAEEMLKPAPIKKFSRLVIDPIAAPSGYITPTEEQLRQVVSYQDNSFDLNNKLRQNRFPEGTSLIDKAISLNKVEHQEVYRVIKGEYSKDLVPGAIIKDAAFMSTTSDKRFAQEMLGDVSEIGSPVLLTIRVPSGTRGLNMNRTMAIAGLDNPFSDQSEVLFRRNLPLKILSIENNKVKCEITHE